MPALRHAITVRLHAWRKGMQMSWRSAYVWISSVQKYVRWPRTLWHEKAHFHLKYVVFVPRFARPARWFAANTKKIIASGAQPRAALARKAARACIRAFR